MFTSLPSPYHITRDTLHNIVWLPTDEAPAQPVQESVRRVCQECVLPLTEIKEGERWYVMCGYFYCAPCYAVVEEQALCLLDSKKKIPWKISVIESEIENHRHFARLEPITKMHFAECVLLQEKNFKQRTEDNRFLRYLWKYLHA